jgi:hypothetical protein
VNSRQESSDEVAKNEKGCEAESPGILNLQMRYHGGLLAMLSEIVVNFFSTQKLSFDIGDDHQIAVVPVGSTAGRHARSCRRLLCHTVGGAKGLARYK